MTTEIHLDLRMRTSDLMYGDWVMIEGEAYQYYAPSLDINSDLDDGIWLLNINGEKYYCGIDNVEPLPLNKYILDRNGFSLFVETSKYDTFRDDKYNISASYCKETKEWLIGVGPSGSIKKRFVEASCVRFVHEFQHILRLCNVDKNVKVY